MKLNDQTLTAITAVCLAIGVGTASYYLRSDNAATPETAKYQPNDLQEPSQDLQASLITSSPTPTATKATPKVFAALTPAPQQPAAPRLESRIPEGACNIKLYAQAKRAARVLLAVTAQCHPKTEITIKHAGLYFRELLDENGEITLTVPAFTEYAKFDISLRDGSKASTGAFITGLPSLNRVGISWQGNNNALLHAHEAPGPQGHIWRDKPHSYKHALLNGGGYMTLLGNPDLPNPSLAEIYTSPNFATKHQKFIDLSVEIQQEPRNCGSHLEMQTAQHSPDSGWSKSRLEINLTECNETTDTLVLNNVVKDMRMTRN